MRMPSAPAARQASLLTRCSCPWPSLAQVSNQVIIAEAFPTNMRGVGVGVCYNVAISIFGGLGPLLCTHMATKDKLAPAYYLAACFLLSSARAPRRPKAPYYRSDRSLAEHCYPVFPLFPAPLALRSTPAVSNSTTTTTTTKAPLAA